MTAAGAWCEPRLGAAGWVGEKTAQPGATRLNAMPQKGEREERASLEGARELRNGQQPE